MKTLKSALLLVVTLVALVSFSASAIDYAPVSPLRADDLGLNQFPVEKGPLSARRQAELGLRSYALTYDALFFNHQRGGHFMLKTVKAGTIVLVDENGNPRYEEKCGNRLIDPRAFAPLVITALLQPPAVVAKAPEKSLLDSARAWVNKLPEPAKLAAHGLSWLIALILLIAAAVLAFWGLSALIGSARHNINARNWHRPTSVG